MANLEFATKEAGFLRAGDNASGVFDDESPGHRTFPMDAVGCAVNRERALFAPPVLAISATVRNPSVILTSQVYQCVGAMCHMAEVYQDRRRSNAVADSPSSPV